MEDTKTQLTRAVLIARDASYRAGVMVAYGDVARILHLRAETAFTREQDAKAKILRHLALSFEAKGRDLRRTYDRQVTPRNAAAILLIDEIGTRLQKAEKADEALEVLRKHIERFEELLAKSYEARAQTIDRLADALGAE